MPGVMTRDTIEPRRAVGLALLAADAGRWAPILSLPYGETLA
jgi:hypothetical protein